MAFVRAAHPDDAPQIADVHLRAWQERYSDWPDSVWRDLQSTESIDTWRRDALAPPSSAHHILVATDDEDRVCGFLVLEPDPDGDARIDLFEIDPHVRTQGHGSRLISAAAEYARADSATGLTLWLDQGSPASRFLTESGWGPRGVRRVLEIVDGVHLSQHQWWTALGDDG